MEQGRLVEHQGLAQIATGYGVRPAQVALAWLLRQPGILAIPKASSLAHVHDNRAALDLDLTADDITLLDRSFPAQTKRCPLEML
jgi:diketogulonate reductase-like aldo/keto reductase